MKASANVFPSLLFAEGAAPGTPAAGQVIAYAKADGLLYIKDDAGTETGLAGGGGGSGTVTSVDLVNTTGLTASGGPITGAGSLTYTLSANLQAWHAIAPSSKADDSAVVHVTGAENVGGVKTFGANPIIAVSGAQAALGIQSDAGQIAGLSFYTGTSMRWAWRKNGDTESGSNAGSNLILNAYSDAGTVLFATVTIARATGIITLSATPVHPTPSAGDNSTKSATTAYVETAVAAVSPIGRHMVPIDAAAMAPRVSGGCAALATDTGAANQPDVAYLAFDATTSEAATFKIQMPASWNEGTVTFVPRWKHPSASTNFGVCWKLRAVAVSDNDTLAASYGTAQSSVDTGGTLGRLYMGPESSAITISGTPATSDVVHFELYREPTDGGDTLAVDAHLLGVDLFITTATATD